MDFYNALIADVENSNVKQVPLQDGRLQTVSGTGEAVVSEIGLYNEAGERVELIRVGEPVELRVVVRVNSDIESLVLGYGVKDRLGQVLYGTNTWHTAQVIQEAKAGEIYAFSVAFPANYGVGSYSIQTALVDKETHLSSNYEWRDLAVVFNVVNVDKFLFVGSLWNEPVITIEKR